MINLSNYYKWYFISKVKFNIIKYTKNSETALISSNKKITLRMLKVHSVQHIDFHLKAINWFKNKWNIYYSIAKYKDGIPNQKFDLRNRDHSVWNENCHRYITDYDFLIDIDASSHEEIGYAQQSALNVCKLLDKYSIPYHIVFSGCGFHIKVPYSFFKSKGYSFLHGEPNSIYRVFASISRRLNKEVSEMIDTTIYEHRRLCKVPYTLALYDEDIYVCMPITLEKLKYFHLNDYKPEQVLKCLD